jgi:hypothetical protein
MNDLILKTVIFILKDKKSGKPFVVTHFQGFKNDDEANDFSKFLTEQFSGDILKSFDSFESFDTENPPPKRTLH